MSEYNYNEKYFESINNEHKAYWLGFLYADGYIEPIYRKNKIKAFRIEIGLSICDKDHIQKFLNDIESNVPIVDKVQKLNNKEYKVCKARINNTKMCRDLINLGCTTKKSFTLEFPNEKIVPKDLLRHFIRGYFDGDGCIHYSERNYIDKRNGKEYTNRQFNVSFVGVENFLKSTINILKGIDSNFEFNNSSNCGKAHEIKLARYKEVLNFYNYIYQDATVYLLRKKEKFELGFNKLNM